MDNIVMINVGMSQPMCRSTRAGFRNRRYWRAWHTEVLSLQCFPLRAVACAGDFIDNTIGIALGLSTITAAAFGQCCSDVSGVVFGGYVEFLGECLLHSFYAGWSDHSSVKVTDTADIDGGTCC